MLSKIKPRPPIPDPSLPGGFAPLHPKNTFWVVGARLGGEGKNTPKNPRFHRHVLTALLPTLILLFGFHHQMVTVDAPTGNN